MIKSKGLSSFVLVTASYFLLALGGLYLADLRGIASPVWPPAGFALAVILLFGRNVLPAIFLGALGANLFNTFYSSGTLGLTNILLAGAIGVGASIQTYISGRLVRRYVQIPNNLEDFKAISLLVLIGGPVGCLINATIGNLALLAAGFVETSQLLFSWLTWWVGDSMGVAVFGPTFLVLLRKETVPFRRKAILVTALLAVFSLSVGAFYKVQDWENSRASQTFTRQGEDIASEFKLRTRIYEKVINGIDRFISSNQGEVSFKDFKHYVSRFLKESPEIKALSWNPKVKQENRMGFEQKKVFEGFSDFQIKDRTKEGDLVRSEARTIYFPVTYIVPLDENKKVLGFDTYSVDPVVGNVRQVSLDSGRDEGQMKATKRMSIVQESSNKYGFIIYHPVYFSEKIPKTLKEKRDKLAGYVAGVFLVPDMVESILGNLEDKGLRLELTDSTDALPVVLYNSISKNKKESKKPKIREGQLQTHHNLTFAGRKWSFEITETDASYLARVEWSSWMVLVCGLLFSVLTSILLLVLTGQADLTRRLVYERTRELNQSREELVKQAKLASLGMMAAGIAHEINNPLAIIGGHAERLSALSRRETLNSAGVLKSSQVVQSTVGRIASIVDGLRKFARDESSANFSSVKVKELVSDTLSFCQERFKNHGIELSVKENYNQEYIECRPTEISQVLVNFLNNSFHAIENLEEKWVEIEVREENNNLRFSVTDSGEGIDSDFVEKVFDPFFTTKPVGKGTGLGLSVSAGIVEGHGGDIWLDKFSSKTKFCFRIPTSPSQEINI